MSSVDAALALLAGLLTILSPCVLPILPIVFAGAAGRHRLGPAALALGVALAFAGTGLFLATIGFSLGLDQESLRPALGVILLVLGVFLLTPRLQVMLEVALAPVVAWGSRNSAHARRHGLAGQFALGALLGAVWSPCVGPTLGAASLLASRGENLGAVAGVMLLFGLGAAAPLLGIGMLSRTALQRLRGGLMTGGRYGRLVLGLSMAAAGLLVLTGVDKQIESAAITMLPSWITDLTTRF